MSEKFQIRLEGTSDTQQWAAAESQLKKLDSAAGDFLNTLKQGVGIDLGGKLVGSVQQLGGLFTGLLERGYEFNKNMAQSEGGIANVLAKFMKLDEQAAKHEAAKAMAAIMEWEPKAAGSLQDLTGGFMSVVGAGTAAKMTVAQVVELVGKGANAVAALSMESSQLTQEMKAIFTGNIGPDAMLAKTLEITPQAIKSAKEAGTLFEYINKQIGALGDTANGPGVVLSSLSSAIDIASGSLAKGLFTELISGAEELTTVLNDPAIKKGLEDTGVQIGALVKSGVQLSIWAVQNAPMLLRVADGAFKVGAAFAAIKLTEIVAGLLLKTSRWTQLTVAMEANTAAMVRNQAVAAGTAVTGGAAGISAGAAAAAGATAGAAGGSSMATSWWAAFKRVPVPPLISSVAVLASTAFALHAVSEYMMAWAASETAKFDAAAASKKRSSSFVEDVQKTASTAATPDEQESALSLAQDRKARLEREAKEQLRQLNEAKAYRASINEFTSPNEAVFAQEAVGRLEQELTDTFEKITKIDQIVDKMATAEGAAEALKNKTLAAEEAEKAFAAALLNGQAAAGQSAAKITVATNAVDALAKKLEEASGSQLDTSTFDGLLKSLQGLDKAKLGEDAMKDVQKLIELAADLRDLKADAAKEAEAQADKAKKAADELRQKEIDKLELQARAAAAADKPELSRDLQARADAIKLRADLEAQGMSPETAAGVVKSEQGADRAKKDKEKADELARKELATQIADLEDEIAARRAEGDKKGEQAAQDRLSTLQLARQLEDQLGLTRDAAEERAAQRIQNERAASDRDALKSALGDGTGSRHSGPARLSAADAWGDGRKMGGLRGDGSSSLDAFNARQDTPLRADFKFPALDAFAAAQPARNGDPGMTPQKEGGAGGGANVASAAKQAAEAATKAREAAAKNDAELYAQFQKLSSELQALASQQEQTQSQLANNRS